MHSRKDTDTNESLPRDLPFFLDYIYLVLTCFIPILTQLDGYDNKTKSFEWGLTK